MLCRDNAKFFEGKWIAEYNRFAVRGTQIGIDSGDTWNEILG
jgi:hypothetical protein